MVGVDVERELVHELVSANRSIYDNHTIYIYVYPKNPCLILTYFQNELVHLVNHIKS